MPLTTRCAHCGRLFPVYAQDLRARRSRVQCPNCGNPFNALAGLIDEPKDTAPATGLGPHRRTTGTAGHPSREARRGQGARTRRPSKLANTSWLILSLSLILALGSQAAWWQRGELLRHPPTRGWLEAACARLGCTLPAPRIAGTLELLDPRLSAPNTGESSGEPLTLSLRVRNAASLAQPPPRIDLELFDLSGDLIAARRFTPTDYGQGEDRLMAPGEAIALELAFVSPGVETSGFKVRLL